MDQQEAAAAVSLSITAAPVRHGIVVPKGDDGPTVLLARIAGRGPLTTQEHIAPRYGPEPTRAAGLILEACAAAGVRIITIWDGAYPPLLREISHPPLVLYGRGAIRCDHGACIALVGTRGADGRSAAIAARLARECSQAGFAIVSGMAIGIDRAAHLGALEAGGATIGVLANGIDVEYPQDNRDLFRRIIAVPGSGLLSEYPPGIRAVRWTFARRNRIISGLSRGVVVVKAGERSGALITARHAVEQNREVFACPGHSFDEGYHGCHHLIREGAHIVTRTEDVLAELAGGIDQRVFSFYAPMTEAGPGAIHTGADHEPVIPPAAAEGHDELEGRVLALLDEEPSDVDRLVRKLQVEAPRVLESVVALELVGAIVRRGTILERVRYPEPGRK